MKNFNPVIDTVLIERLREKYFFDSCKVLHLKKGEYLIQSKTKNDKLFFLTKGLIAGYLVDDLGQQYEIFRTEKNMIVGVNSFFSEHHNVYADVIAMEDSSVLYITRDELFSSSKDCYAEDFLPIIVHELSLRQQFSGNVMLEKEAALKKLYQNEKLATLGQMSAGLAHEMNNTSGVINGNVSWLAQNISEYFRDHEQSSVLKYYEKGVNEGQQRTSEEVRALKEKISMEYDIPAQLAKKIARIGFEESEIKNIRRSKVQRRVELYYHFWQMGVAIHDILLASKHSTHILQSIKQLSSTGLERFEINVNDSIREALTLLKKRLEGIAVSSELLDVPNITANNGELVQVWINLIKNASESLHGNKQNDKKLHIDSCQKFNSIHIRIWDNGGGIKKSNIEKIFRPNFTTKKGGLSFGLGLGLSIVQRIINSYDGSIQVESKKSETIFTIILPIQ